jgi:hypothetical protein
MKQLEVQLYTTFNHFKRLYPTLLKGFEVGCGGCKLFFSIPQANPLNLILIFKDNNRMNESCVESQSILG